MVVIVVIYIIWTDSIYTYRRCNMFHWRKPRAWSSRRRSRTRRGVEVSALNGAWGLIISIWIIYIYYWNIYIIMERERERAIYLSIYLYLYIYICGKNMEQYWKIWGSMGYKRRDSSRAEALVSYIFLRSMALNGKKIPSMDDTSNPQLSKA